MTRRLDSYDVSFDPYSTYEAFEPNVTYYESVSSSDSSSSSISYGELDCKLEKIQIRDYHGRVICEATGCLETSHPIAKRLFNSVQAISQFMKDRFGLCGINGGGEIREFYLGLLKPNAFWNCASAERNSSCNWHFNNQFALDPRIVAHEYAHAWVDRLTGLGKMGEAGALHESFADVMAIIFAHAMGPAQGILNNWKIGNLRNLSPHIDTRAFQKVNRYTESNDYGKVHDNSRIPSHAFKRAVDLSGEGANGRIADVWFRAILKVSPDETFTSFALKTIQEAKKLRDPRIYEAVVKSWGVVGIIKIQPPDASLRLANLSM